MPSPEGGCVGRVRCRPAANAAASSPTAPNAISTHPHHGKAAIGGGACGRGSCRLNGHRRRVGDRCSRRRLSSRLGHRLRLLARSRSWKRRWCWRSFGAALEIGLSVPRQRRRTSARSASAATSPWPASGQRPSAAPHEPGALVRPGAGQRRLELRGRGGDPSAHAAGSGVLTPGRPGGEGQALAGYRRGQDRAPALKLTSTHADP